MKELKVHKQTLEPELTGPASHLFKTQGREVDAKGARSCSRHTWLSARIHPRALLVRTCMLLLTRRLHATTKQSCIEVFIDHPSTTYFLFLIYIKMYMRVLHGLLVTALI